VIPDAGQSDTTSLKSGRCGRASRQAERGVQHADAEVMRLDGVELVAGPDADE
jgi:hypothetical protein